MLNVDVMFLKLQLSCFTEATGTTGAAADNGLTIVNLSSCNAPTC